jgi:hypothetical protein
LVTAVFVKFTGKLELLVRVNDCSQPVGRLLPDGYNETDRFIVLGVMEMLPNKNPAAPATASGIAGVVAPTTLPMAVTLVL